MESPGMAGAPPAPSDAPPSATPGVLPAWPPWAGPLALVAGLILALFGALVVDIPAAVLGVKLTSDLPPGIQIADTFVQDVAFVAAAVLVAGMGGRAVRAWQFGLRPTAPLRAAGGVLLLFVGFLAFNAAWSAALNLQGKEKLLDQLGANHNAALLVASATLTCVVAPVCEEILFRGLMFTALRRWRGPWVAALITGLLFGAVHASSAPAAYLVPLAALGFGLCLLYWRTGSLYPCIAAHCINNALAFGVLESWGWQIPVLMASSLVAIAGLFLAAGRAGLLGRAPVAAVA